MRNFVKILLLFSLLGLSSCAWFGKSATKSFLRNSNVPMPPGSPLFQRGFEVGCAQILYSRGNFFYRTLFGYHYDTALNYNKDYRFGYKRGYNACFITVIATKIPSFDRALFPSIGAGGNDIGTGFYSQTNYDDTSGMFGGILNSSVGGDVNGVVENAGSGGGVFSANPLWAGNSKGQFFGQ